MNKKQNISKWMTLAAVLMYAAAVFQITDEKFILGAVFFSAGTCFAAAAAKFRKTETYKSDHSN